MITLLQIGAAVVGVLWLWGNIKMAIERDDRNRRQLEHLRATASYYTKKEMKK